MHTLVPVCTVGSYDKPHSQVKLNWVTLTWESNQMLATFLQHILCMCTYVHNSLHISSLPHTSSPSSPSHPPILHRKITMANQMWLSLTSPPSTRQSTLPGLSVGGDGTSSSVLWGMHCWRSVTRLPSPISFSPSSPLPFSPTLRLYTHLFVHNHTS